MPTRRSFIAFAVAAALIASSAALTQAALAQDKSIVVASTTSTQDSGLFGHILPLFKKKTGIDVRVISQGTGQALDTGRRGDADVVFVHAQAAGGEVRRRRLRRAALSGDVQRLHPGRAEEQSRRHQRHQGHRRRAQDHQGQRRRVHLARRQVRHACRRARALEGRRHRHREGAAGTWYKEIGQGMGAALNTASASNAYVLADRGTWLSFKNRGDLVIAVEGDNRLFNQYGVMLVNPEKHKHVKKELGQAFIDWLVSAEGQKAIADYKIGGQQLFFPNANAPGA